MENIKTTIKFFVLAAALVLGACNNSGTEKVNGEGVGASSNSGSEKENGEGVKSETKQETKILVFEQQSGSNENQKTEYKLSFQGDSVEISYQYSNNAPIIEKAELKDGKVVTEGCSDCYAISQGNLCIPNPETGESDCYQFNKSKSTHSIEETIYPSKNNLTGNEGSGNFQGEELKKGEKIIKINWGMENKTRLNTDMSDDEVRFTSKPCIVPSGKKWVLLYINEDFTFESGNVVSSIPYLFIDKNEEKFSNRRFSNPNNIHLAQAKDENFKYYSNSTIKAISSRRKGTGLGGNFIDYKGEIWFLEVNAN